MTKMTNTVKNECITKVELSEMQKEMLTKIGIVYGKQEFEEPEELLFDILEFPDTFEYFESHGLKTPLYFPNSGKDFRELITKRLVDLIVAYTLSPNSESNIYYDSFELYLFTMFEIYRSFSNSPELELTERYLTITFDEYGILDDSNLVYKQFKYNVETYKSITA